MHERLLSVKQPWADLILAGVKPVENRTWRVPSTLPQWWRCPYAMCSFERTLDAGEHDCRVAPYQSDLHWQHQTLRVTLVADGPFPFRVFIHAGLTFADGWRRVADQARLWHPEYGYAPWVTQDRLGAVVGSVLVTGCHHADECGVPVPTMTGVPTFHHCSPWAEPDCWHWELGGAVRFDAPIPWTGGLGLRHVPDDLRALIGRQNQEVA